MREAVHEFERAKIAEAVALSHGNKKDAAHVLGICREGLHVKIRKLGMKTKIAALGPDGRSKGRNGA